MKNVYKRRQVEVVVATLETPRGTYRLYSVPECRLFALYDGRTAFDRVPRQVLDELAAAKRAGEFAVEVVREAGAPIYSGGSCVAVKLRPRLTIVRGKYGVYVLRGRRLPLAPEEDLRLILSIA